MANVGFFPCGKLRVRMTRLMHKRKAGRAGLRLDYKEECIRLLLFIGFLLWLIRRGCGRSCIWPLWGRSCVALLCWRLRVINGTMAGPEETVGAFLGLLEERAGLKRSEVKFSTSEKAPFRRLKFKCKREIITFRAEEPVDPARPGTYVEAADWNALVADRMCWCWIRAIRMRRRWGVLLVR